MTVTTLPMSEEVARSYVAPLWNLRTLPEALRVWRSRSARPRCGWCVVGTCCRPSTATSRYCVRHQRRAGR